MITKEDIILHIKDCLNYLNNIQKLPKKGILAGGAISNYILSKFHNITPIINDIDIFMLNETLNNISYIKKNNYDNYYKLTKKKIEIEKTRISTNYNEYFSINTISKNSNFLQILTSETDNKINIIRYNTHKYDPYDLLDSFDINCTKIAYDLETDIVYITDDYIDFLNTKKLEIININTPCQLLLRLLKKKDELNVKLDLDETYYLIKIAYCSNHDDYIRKYFSDKYYNIFKKYENELKKYCTIKPKKYVILYDNNIDNFEEKYQKFKDIINDSRKTMYGRSLLFGTKEYDMWRKIVYGKTHNLYTLNFNKNLFDIDDTTVIKYNYNLSTFLIFHKQQKKSKNHQLVYNTNECKHFLLNENYLNINNINDKKFELKLKLIRDCIKIFPKFKKSLFKYNFDNQYDLIVNNFYYKLKTDNTYFFYLKFNEFDFSYKNEKHEKFLILINSLKYKYYISIIKYLSYNNKIKIGKKIIKDYNYNKIIRTFISIIDHYHKKKRKKNIKIPENIINNYSLFQTELELKELNL